jgi:hypothetical protein
MRSTGAAGPRPQLPAFCRTRRPVVTVTASSIASLRLLVLLGLVFQLSTLLLVIAGPLPQRPVDSSTVFQPDAGPDGGGYRFTPHPYPPRITPLADR